MTATPTLLGAAAVLDCLRCAATGKEEWIVRKTPGQIHLSMRSVGVEVSLGMVLASLANLEATGRIIPIEGGWKIRRLTPEEVASGKGRKGSRWC